MRQNTKISIPCQVVPTWCPPVPKPVPGHVVPLRPWYAHAMSTYRVTKGPQPYVVLDKGFLDSPHLSWRAKGLLAYLLARPDDWQVREADLVAHATDGRDSVRAALRQLKFSGYIVRSQAKAKSGRFKGAQWDVHERPISPAHSHYIVVSDSPATGNQSAVEMPANSQFADTDRLQRLMDQAKAEGRQ